MKRIVEEQFNSGRVRLTLWETFSYYLAVLPILMFTPILWMEEVYSNTGNDFPYGIVATIGIMLFFIYRQYSLLRFKKYAIKHTADQFKEAAKATAIDLKWDIETLDDSQLKANRNDLSWSWVGTRITIIRTDVKIYENSIVEPAIGAHPFTFGRAARNLNQFNTNLLQAVEGENVLQNAELVAKKAKEDFENEPEWNLKNTFKRVIIYFVIVLLLGVSFMGLRDQFHPLFVLVLVICIGYLVMDIFILIKKNKMKKT